MVGLHCHFFPCLGGFIICRLRLASPLGVFSIYFTLKSRAYEFYPLAQLSFSLASRLSHFLLIWTSFSDWLVLFRALLISCFNFKWLRLILHYFEVLHMRSSHSLCLSYQPSDATHNPLRLGDDGGNHGGSHFAYVLGMF